MMNGYWSNGFKGNCQSKEKGPRGKGTFNAEEEEWNWYGRKLEPSSFCGVTTRENDSVGDANGLYFTICAGDETQSATSIPKPKVPSTWRTTDEAREYVHNSIAESKAERGYTRFDDDMTDRLIMFKYKLCIHVKLGSTSMLSVVAGTRGLRIIYGQ